MSQQIIRKHLAQLRRRQRIIKAYDIDDVVEALNNLLSELRASVTGLEIVDKRLDILDEEGLVRLLGLIENIQAASEDINNEVVEFMAISGIEAEDDAYIDEDDIPSPPTEETRYLERLEWDEEEEEDVPGEYVGVT